MRRCANGNWRRATDKIATENASCAFIVILSRASHAGTEFMDEELERAQVGQSSRSIGITFVPTVERAFERALAGAKARSSPVLTILVEGDTYSAELLRKYGLRIQSAENTKLEQYLRRSKEQAKRLAEMQERARWQRQQTAGAVLRNAPASPLELRTKTDASDASQQQNDAGHKAYTLRISSDDHERDRVQFKAAVSRNGILDLYVEETPFEIELVASTIVGLFEAVEGGDRLKVQLVTELEGQQRVVSGFSGSAGAIFRDRHTRLGQRSGVLD
jgi:hypothetical protein